MKCPDAHTLYDYASGRLPAEQSRRIDEHCRSCASCARELKGILSYQKALSVIPPSRAPKDFNAKVFARLGAPQRQKNPVYLIIPAAACVALIITAALFFQADMSTSPLAPVAVAPDTHIEKSANRSVLKKSAAKSKGFAAGSAGPAAKSETWIIAFYPARQMIEGENKELAAQDAAAPSAMRSAKNSDADESADRTDAEKMIRGSIARAGGKVVSIERHGATVRLAADIPAAAIDLFISGLESAGTVRAEKPPHAGETVRVVVTSE